MNSKIILTTSSVVFFAFGILTSFAPEILLSFLKIEYTLTATLVAQAFGAFNIAMGILNWMSKSSLFGGIYNRPIGMANLAYFFMAGLAIIKGLLNVPEAPLFIWGVGIIYLAFAIAFWLLLFKNPIPNNK
ncbi:MAG: hypothetical protein PHC28_07370 [Flavobacterium sp.]|uniref:hypothetical protein n=1 Tax=Flavobacterium sp. TaxID=239 RepID=UPI002610B3F8|nr:hypothetical protein [Flavobacterium sp.]MDD5150290.1 hypothetical protein [Flavobacterium sp.]